MLGLKGFGAEVFNNVGSTVIGKVVGNLSAANASAADMFKGFGSAELFEKGGVGNLGLNALGSFLGAKLGSMVVSPTTQAGALLSSIGSAAGAYIAVAHIGTAVFGTSKLASMLGNLIVPGIGAFVGFVLGALIGNLFGRKKPKIPTANAEIYLDYTSDKFQLGASSAANGGNLDLVRNMAETARDTLNGFLTVLAGDMPYEATSWGIGLWRNGKYLAMEAGLQSFYGHTGGQLWVKLGSPTSTQQNVGSADDAVSKGVMWSLQGTQVIGGDIFAKRALANSKATDLTALLGDLQIAEDYRFYANNRELINGYITGAYKSLTEAEKTYYASNKAVIDKAHTKGVSALTSSELSLYNANKAKIDKIVSALEDQAIANPWIITLQRINELKLDQWSKSDFYGGLQGFLTSMGLESYSAYMENIQVTDVLGGLTLSVDSAKAEAGVFSLLPQAFDAPVGNMLHNPGWEQGLVGWGVNSYQLASVSRGVNLSGVWGSADTPTYYLHASGATVSGAYADSTSAMIQIKGGVVYDFSVMAAQHRSLGQAYVQFLDVNRQHLDYSSLSGTALEGGGANGDLTKLSKLSATFTAPANAAYVRLSFRMRATGEANPYAFFAQPTVKVAGGPALDWSQGGNAIRIDDLSKIGYVKQTVGNTSGNDFLDFTASTAPVIWSDMSVETHWETRYDQYGYEYQEEVTVTVSGGDDIVVGGSAGDTLSGMAGWDWLDGKGGNDILYGGAGNDVLLGGAGADQLFGGADDDYLSGGDGNDILNGEDGDDILVGGLGADTLNGGAGNDTFIIEGNGHGDIMDGGAGSNTMSFERADRGVYIWLRSNTADRALDGSFQYNYTRQNIWGVTGSAFADEIRGGAYADVLKGGDGDDLLWGFNGDDLIEGGAGADDINGEGGIDTASYQGSNAGVYIDLTGGEAFGGHATGDKIAGIENLTGSRFADELKGDNGGNRIDGGAGDDWIVATRGADTYVGGEGVDTVDYSSGFATGVSTYQQWVDDGYEEWDDWEKRWVWVENGGHYETVTGTRLGLQIAGGIASWRAADGTTGEHSLAGVEHVIGTTGADTISLTGADEFITAGKGNDTLNGGGGSDTYYFNLGDGVDTITETNVGSNVVSFGDGIGFNQLTFTVVAGPTGHMTIHYSATDSVRVNGNLPNVKDGKLASADDNKLKVIDMNGSGQLDVSQFEIYRGGTAAADPLSGIRTLGDFLVGFGGNDTIHGMQVGQWSEWGDIIIGGAGNDTSFTSTGDDQFAFERGSGRDTINDTGGDDVLVFGPNVAADDVIYKVVGNDLYIGIAEAANPNLEAHQVTDYVRVVGGGVKWQDVYGGGASFNTVEFINAGGTWIDLRKLDINWTVQNTYNGGVLPIVFDLEGDGLELTGVDHSMVVSRLSSGELARTSWVGPTDGILAVDRNGDGQINQLSEISFVQDKEGAKTDLEGLQAWDTNGDGKLNALDDGWGQLKIWVDRNQNGRSTESELRTLEEVGITEINLAGKATGNTAANTRDSFVHNTLSFTWASGETGTAYDVQLARKLLSEYGLSVDQVKAIWGEDRSVEGELGRLLDNPVVAAAARTVLDAGRSLRTKEAWMRDALLLREVLDADLGDHGTVEGAAGAIATPPVADFSDHDDLYAEDEARWRDVLFGDGDDGRGANVTDPSVRASLEAFFGQAGRGAYGSAFGRPDIDDGVGEPAVPADGGEVGPIGSRVMGGSGHSSDLDQPLPGQARQTSAGDLDPALAAATDLISTGSEDLWAPAEFGLASTESGRSWWLQGEGVARFSDGGSFLAALDPITEGLPASAGVEQLSQHQKLTQALAAFGRDKGASAAVWKRSGEIEAEATSQMLGASGSRFAALARMPA